MKSISVKNFTLLSTLLFQNCIPYLYHVSSEQSKIILNREKISTIVQDNNSDEKTKIKLKLIQAVRNFAIKEIHLNPKGGFEYFTKLDREEVGWNVSASYPLKFESYTWWFPFAGTVPYKGYFELAKAKEEEKSLIEKGLDTRVRITAGYSTLGWFSDPVLSPQLRMTEDELVSLVIHEMSHATVYFPGDSNFNESYAKQTALKLKEMYERSDLSDSEKLTQKKIIIEDYRLTILKNTDKFTKFDPEKFKTIPLNNENFIGILRYHSGSKFFHDAFTKVDGDFMKFHEEMEKIKALTIEERAVLLKH